MTGRLSPAESVDNPRTANYLGDIVFMVIGTVVLSVYPQLLTDAVCASAESNSTGA